MPRKSLHPLMKWIKTYYWIIILSIILASICAISHAILWDEYVYLANARSHYTQSNFSEDYRFPLLEWVISGVWTVSGESILAIRILMALVTLGVIISTYHLLRNYTSDQYARVWALLLGITPLVLYWSVRIYTDILALFFVMLALLYIYKFDTTARMHWIIGAGIASGLAFLSRFTTGILILSIGVYLIYKWPARKVLIYGITILLIILPWITYNAVMYHDPIWDLKAQYHVAQTATPFNPHADQLTNLVKTINGGVLIFALIGIYAMLRAKYRVRNNKQCSHAYTLLLLGYVIMTLLYFIMGAALQDERYILSILPLLIVFAAIGLEYVYRYKKKFSRITRIVIIAGLFIITLLMLGMLIQKEYNAAICAKNNALIQSLTYLDQTIPPDARTIATHEEFLMGGAWPAYGYVLNVKANSLWSTNISMIIDTYHPRYILYDTLQGLPYNQSLIEQYAVREATFTGTCGDKVYIYRTRYAPSLIKN